MNNKDRKPELPVHFFLRASDYLSIKTDYERFCRLEELSLEDRPEHDQASVYIEFREQLQSNECKVGMSPYSLSWKGQLT